jgi:hypothetical protein
MIFNRQWLYHPSSSELIYFDENGRASYEIQLDRVEEAGPDSVVEWIFHLLDKSWAGPVTIYGLVQALEYFYKKRRPRDWRVFPRPEEMGRDGIRAVSFEELSESVDQSDLRWAGESKKLAERAIEAGLIQRPEE